MVDINYYRQDHSIKKCVLQVIRKQQPITRADLAGRTGLSMTSLIKCTSALINEGIVSEQGALESTGGRKSTLLGINPDFAYIIGIDLGGYASRFGVIRVDGSIVDEWIYPTTDLDMPAPVKGMNIDSLNERISAILDQYGCDRFLAICVGISGMVDHKAGKIIFCPNIDGWNNMPLADILRQEYDMPVFVDTSARCMGLAESLFGAGAGIENQVFVSLGSFDISAAIIIENRIFRGSHGFSGEIGHVMSSDAGVLCTCGNYDCLELSATMKMIEDDIRHRVNQFTGLSPMRQILEAAGNPQRLIPELINQALEAGDKQCREAIDRAGVRTGTALANMLNILNPELVILGGGVIESFPDMLDIIRDTIRKRALITVQQNVEIKKAALGWRSAIVGSAALAIEYFFA